MFGGLGEGLDLFEELVEGFVACDGLGDAFFAEEGAVGVACFGDAIGDDDEAAAGLELDMADEEFGAVDHADGEVGFGEAERTGLGA